MKHIFYPLAIALIATSCSSLKNIKVSQIEDIWFVYSPNQDLNHGSEFEGEIMLQTFDGKQHDMSRNSKLSVSSVDLARQGRSKTYTIVKKSSNFNEAKCELTLRYNYKDEEFVSADSVMMNFQGPLRLLYNGANGINGEHQRSKGTPLLWRDGKDGEHGPHGTDGESAESHTIHIWKDDSFVYLHVTKMNSGNIFKYQMIPSNSIHFDFSGGNGGNGGDGGDGGNGKDGELKGEKIKRAGDAGNGGNGGNAGSGGNGGDLKVILHSNCSEMEQYITYNVSGGRAGNPGEAGKAGRAGSPLTGQQAGRAGWNGTHGQTAFTGSNGSYSLFIEDFNIDEYYKR